MVVIDKTSISKKVYDYIWNLILSKELKGKINQEYIAQKIDVSRTPVTAALQKLESEGYLIIKPYSQHKKSFNREYQNLSYKKFFYLKDALKKFNSDKFQVIFRENPMKKLKEKRSYEICHAVPFFWAHITTNGDVYSCGNFIGDKRFNLGNYNKKSFKEIWEGEKRKKHWKFIQTKFNVNQCRKNCRVDEINRYLEKLINPPEHVNFI